MAYKMKGSAFYGKGNQSPIKHTKSRSNHMEKYGKGHTNEAHPNYWKDGEKKIEQNEDIIESNKEKIKEIESGLGIKTDKQEEKLRKEIDKQKKDPKSVNYDPNYKN